jgi:hypothetical protein
LQLPLRKKLFRFTTGISLYPAIKINPGSHSLNLLSRSIS